MLDLLHGRGRPGRRAHPARDRARARRDGVGAVRARAVVLATGGMGQVFAATTNPSVSTGDGVALALRAGAERGRPGVRAVPPDRAVPRADGARASSRWSPRRCAARARSCVDADGKRFMVGRARARRPRAARRRRQGDHAPDARERRDHVCLDARHLGADSWTRRFPTILARCREHGIDPVTEPIPVAPAATTPAAASAPTCDGRTTVPGLYACGEVACTGVHGANRLASQLAAGGPGLRRADRRRPRRRPAGPQGRAEPSTDRPGLLDAAAPRSRCAATMTEGAGVLRSDRVAARGTADGSPSCAGDRPPSRVDRGLGGDQPAHRRVASLAAAARSARRPAARTGARTSPTATTRSGAAPGRDGWRAGTVQSSLRGDRRMTPLPADLRGAARRRRARPGLRRGRWSRATPDRGPRRRRRRHQRSRPSPDEQVVGRRLRRPRRRRGRRAAGRRGRAVEVASERQRPSPARCRADGDRVARGDVLLTAPGRDPRPAAPPSAPR